jgi:hypothetical protein
MVKIPPALPRHKLNISTIKPPISLPDINPS